MSKLGRALGAAAIVACALVPVQTARAVELPDPGWSAAPTSATTNLVDGQRVVINVKSRSDVSVNGLEIRECRYGVAYATSADTLPNAGNCPPLPVSSSADSFVSRGASNGLTALAHTAAGVSVPFFVGSGVVAWTGSAKYTLTCDPTHPCALVLKLNVGSATVFQVVKLTFIDSNPLGACGGFARGVLATGGSDEISDAWAQWTRSECARTGKGAPTSVSFVGEGPAVTSFSNGSLDLAYTAAGYNRDVGLVSEGAPARPAVAIPIALNASVIAAGGGQHQLVGGVADGDKAPYAEASLKLSAAQVGALLGGGEPWVSRTDKPYAADMIAQNPALQGILYSPDAGVYAPSQSLASSWFMTKYLSALAPGDFVRPTVVPAAPHGPVSSFAVSNPPFDQITLYTGRPSLAKVTVPAERTPSDGPIWTMTDLASARALDLTPVALQSGGGFVAPTAESMDAAVAAMTPDAQGLLVPTPSLATTAAAPGAVQPYPLTYVVYALVPSQPLVDPTTCALRSGSQAELTSWLGYLTGAGQGQLPPGMQPLPPALLANAKQAVSLVGAAKITGPCAGKQPSGGGGGGHGGNGPKAPHGGTFGGDTGGGGAAGPGGTGSSFSGGSFTSSARLGGAGGSTLDGVTVPGSTRTGPRRLRAAEAALHIPAFGGRSSAGSIGAVLALFGIALVTSAAAWISAVQLRRRRSGATGRVDGSVLARAGALGVMWVGVIAIGVVLVMFSLGPVLQERNQRALVARYRTTVSNAANELQGLPGASASDAAPDPGSPVGIVEIGALHAQDVVVEGVGSEQTSRAPGHVPGTAGLGQPGNSVVVARRQAFGGDFAHLSHLHAGDNIVVTTTQGQSVYVVREVHSVKADEALYAPSEDDRLTLVTSASSLPWDTSRAVEVVARLSGLPFAPTPQQARSVHATGTRGDSASVPSVVLALLVLAAAIAGSIALYSRLRFRSAYILSVAPLVAITVVSGETIARLLPAWS